jgi:hypothetical protein
MAFHEDSKCSREVHDDPCAGAAQFQTGKLQQPAPLQEVVRSAEFSILIVREMSLVSACPPPLHVHVEHALPSWRSQPEHVMQGPPCILPARLAYGWAALPSSFTAETAAAAAAAPLLVLKYTLCERLHENHNCVCRSALAGNTPRQHSQQRQRRHGIPGQPHQQRQRGLRQPQHDAAQPRAR